MKDWCYIDIPDWCLVQPALQKFIVESVKDSTKVFNHIELTEFNQNCAEATILIESYFESRIERISVFKMTQESIKHLGAKLIHIDSGFHGRIARLNWPVLNPGSVVTKYFKITDAGYQPARQFLKTSFGDYVDVYAADVCKEISQVCIDRPTAFSVTTTPHGMFAAGDQWPRLMCSFNFVDDTKLIKYLA